jgi:hypothetical protein
MSGNGPGPEGLVRYASAFEPEVGKIKCLVTPGGTSTSASMVIVLAVLHAKRWKIPKAENMNLRSIGYMLR